MLGYEALWRRRTQTSEKDLLDQGVTLRKASEEEKMTGLTEREVAILRLKAEEVTDYRITRKPKDGNTQRTPVPKQCFKETSSWHILI